MSINIWKHIVSDGNMRKFILISMITLASVSLGACRQNVTIKQDAPGQKAFLTDGQIYDLHSGKIISSSELLADLATAQHLIIGEKHDNAEHHQIELWLIQNLLIQRPQGSVLLEMLTSEQQPRVNQVKCWLKDNPVVRDSRVQELLNWQKGGPGRCMATSSCSYYVGLTRCSMPTLAGSRYWHCTKKTNFLKEKIHCTCGTRSSA